MEERIILTIKSKKNIALIAHDGKKQELSDWCKENFTELSNHKLYGTGTTSKKISNETGLCITGFNSGPLGGDQQIGAKISEGDIDLVIFFSDPLSAQPHDPDIRALLRIAQVYDIPMAGNKATADFLITSKYMNSEYNHSITDFSKIVEKRAETL